MGTVPLVGVFNPLPEVRRAAVVPSIIASLTQLVNGVTYIGEGVMIGMQSFRTLAIGQVLATSVFILSLQVAPKSLSWLWMCYWPYHGIRFANVMLHHFVS